MSIAKPGDPRITALIPVLEASLDAVAVLDGDGKVIYLNASMRAFLALGTRHMKEDFAFGGGHESGNAFEERGFAGAGRSHQTRELTGPEVEGEVADGLDVAAVGLIDLLQTPDGQHRLIRHSRFLVNQHFLPLSDRGTSAAHAFPSTGR